MNCKPFSVQKSFFLHVLCQCRLRKITCVFHIHTHQSGGGGGLISPGMAATALHNPCDSSRSAVTIGSVLQKIEQNELVGSQRQNIDQIIQWIFKIKLFHNHTHPCWKRINPGKITRSKQVNKSWRTNSGNIPGGA